MGKGFLRYTFPLSGNYFTASAKEGAGCWNSSIKSTSVEHALWVLCPTLGVSIVKQSYGLLSCTPLYNRQLGLPKGDWPHQGGMVRKEQSRYRIQEGLLHSEHPCCWGENSPGTCLTHLDLPHIPQASQDLV